LLEARRRGSLRGYFLAGLVAAATALVRENALLFALAMIVFLAWRMRGTRRALAFAAGVALGIAPSALHNFSYDHEWIPITSQMGQNFYTGAHAGNDGGGYLVPDFVRRSPRFEEIDFAAEAQRRAGRTLTPGETSSFWMREALRDLAADPLRLPRLFVRKLDLLYRDREIPDDEDIRFFRNYAPVLRAPLPGFGLFGVLGIVGLAWALARRRAPGELVSFVGVYTVSVASFFVFSRYRLPLVAPFAVFAGFALRELFVAARNRDVRTLGVAGAAIVALSFVIARPVPGVESLANSYLSVGIAYEVQHRDVQCAPY
jgi:hypothetical protein